MELVLCYRKYGGDDGSRQFRMARRFYLIAKRNVMTRMSKMD